MPSKLFHLAGATAALVALAGCLSTNESASGSKSVFASLHAAYKDQPFKGGQKTPQHEWLRTEDGRLLFIHWDTENPAEATRILWVGDGFYAKGCIGPGGISREEIAAGYVHFHKETSPNWDAGHMTDPTNPNVFGYWLRHIQVDPQASMGSGMGGPPSPVGKVYRLMDSTGNAPACT